LKEQYKMRCFVENFQTFLEVFACGSFSCVLPDETNV